MLRASPASVQALAYALPMSCHSRVRAAVRFRHMGFRSVLVPEKNETPFVSRLKTELLLDVSSMLPDVARRTSQIGPTRTPGDLV